MNLSPCLDDDGCARLIDGPMSPDDRRRALEHLAGCLECAELVAELARQRAGDGGARDPLAGVSFGRYQVLEPLGAGVSALVYRANDPALDRDVALKLLRELSPELRERMLAESRALARITHPNVVTVHDVGEVDGELFVAMELVTGDLRRWVERERPVAARILEVIWKASRGLEAIHAAGLVHRDIKPENILVDGDGRVLVADLGLAEGSRAEVPGAGTPGYLPPEVEAGEPATRHGDQWALCLTAALLCGVDRQAIGERPALIAALRGRGIDAASARALARGLSTSPAERFDSVAALRDAARRRGRRRIELASVAALAVAAAVLGVMVLGGGDPLPTARCGPLSDRLAALWPGPHGAAIAERSAPAHRALSAYHRELRTRRIGVCLETLTDPPAPGALRRGGCLDERGAELAATAAVLVEIESGAVIDAAYAASPISSCVGRGFAPPPIPPERAAEVVSARAELAAIRALYQVSDYRAASRRLDALAAGALARDYPPIQAEVLHHRGAIAHGRGDYRAAVRALEEAVLAGERAGHDEVRLRALSGLLAIPDLDPGRKQELIDDIEALVDRAADPFLASVANHRLGIAAVERGDLEAAGELFQSVYRYVSAHHSDDHPRVAQAHQSLGGVAMLQNQLDEAERHFRLALRGTRGAYGNGDPRTARALASVANMVGKRDPDAAAEMMEEAVDIFEETGGPEHPDTLQAVVNLCATLVKTPERARPHCERGVAIAERLDPGRTTAWALMAAGANELEAREYAAALAHLERAAAVAPGRPESDLELADLRYYTAQALVHLDREPRRARDLLVQVKRRWRSDPFRAEKLEGIDEIIAELERRRR
jgi:tetratricopeptide (TPR) repeat protein